MIIERQLSRNQRKLERSGKKNWEKREKGKNQGKLRKMAEKPVKKWRGKIGGKFRKSGENKGQPSRMDKKSGKVANEGSGKIEAKVEHLKENWREIKMGRK